MDFSQPDKRIYGVYRRPKVNTAPPVEAPRRTVVVQRRQDTAAVDGVSPLYSVGESGPKPVIAEEPLVVKQQSAIVAPIKKKVTPEPAEVPKPVKPLFSSTPAAGFTDKAEKKTSESVESIKQATKEEDFPKLPKAELAAYARSLNARRLRHAVRKANTKLRSVSRGNKLSSGVSKRLGKVKSYRYSFQKNHLLYAMAVAVFMVGIGASLQSVFINQKAENQVKAIAKKEEKKTAPTTAAISPAVPSEEPPTAAASPKRYEVAPLNPRILSIKKLGVNVRVLSLSVDDNNQMKTPTNIYDTAWYNASARPGEPGATVINGHVSGPTRKGSLYNIKALVAGDEIEIERGDKTVIKYAVKSVETIPAEKVDMVKLLNPIERGKSGLNLITCGGKFNSETNKYPDRVMVYATQI